MVELDEKVQANRHQILTVLFPFFSESQINSDYEKKIQSKQAQEEVSLRKPHVAAANEQIEKRLVYCLTDMGYNAKQI